MWTFIGGQLGVQIRVWVAGLPLSWLAGHEGGRIFSLACKMMLVWRCVRVSELT